MVFAAEQLSMNLVLLLDMNPVDIVSHLLWLQPDERFVSSFVCLCSCVRLCVCGIMMKILDRDYDHMT